MTGPRPNSSWGDHDMRNLLALFAVVILVFAAVGWYLDWYKIKTEPAPAGHHHVNIDFNGPKIREDSQKGVQKVEEKVQKILDNKVQAEKTKTDKTDQDFRANPPPSTTPRFSIEQEKEQPQATGPDLP